MKSLGKPKYILFAGATIAAFVSAAPPTSASTASSGAYSLAVDLNVTPLGFPLAHAGIGPVAPVFGMAAPDYALNNTLLTFDTSASIVSTLPLNIALTAGTGLLVNNASGSTAGAAFASADSTTNALAIGLTATPLVGPVVALGSIGATTLTSSTRVDGPYGAITSSGTSNIVGLDISGILGADLAALGSISASRRTRPPTRSCSARQACWSRRTRKAHWAIRSAA